jgi:hypothetical protein
MPARNAPRCSWSVTAKRNRIGLGWACVSIASLTVYVGPLGPSLFPAFGLPPA